MRVGIAHHFGWAVAVTASAEHEVVDRRRIDLIEPGVATAPIHHEGKNLEDDAVVALVAEVRASARRATSASLVELAADVPEPIVSLSLRSWPADIPDEIAVLRRAPYEARADSVMYRKVLTECAQAQGWDVHFFEAKDVESQAATVVGGSVEAILQGPRAVLGPPWNKTTAWRWRRPSSRAEELVACRQCSPDESSPSSRAERYWARFRRER